MDQNDVLLKRFTAITSQEIHAMKSRREPEGLQLDFKRMQTSGDPSADDQDNLKKAVSGYANSVGGIVLWGVTTKDGSKETHRFVDYVPILDADLAEKRLHELAGEATDPPVDGARHERVEVPGGFVIKTLIPASDKTPHRTRDRNGQYYKRSADRFLAMEHFEIADMFGRRARPRLEFFIQSEYSNEPRLAFGLRNVGRGIARFPFVSMKLGPLPFEISKYGLDGNGRFGLSRLLEPSGGSADHRFGGGADSVIHSGSDLLISRIDFHGMVNWNQDKLPLLVVHASHAAEDCPFVTTHVEVDVASEFRAFKDAVRRESK